MNQFQLTFKRYGSKAILIEWPDRIDDSIADDILRFKQQLNRNLHHSMDIIDVIAAYNSVTIIHKNEVSNFQRRVEILIKIHTQSLSADLDTSQLIHIPVCYEESLAKDLSAFLTNKNLSKDQLIELHTKPLYRVYFLGFLPGFMYLGGLEEELFCDRKGIPDMNVPKGAIAIGGKQTGIYPQESPGGWHVIGNSPLKFFNPDSHSACFALAGDRIKFNSISYEEYLEIKGEVEQGSYITRHEVYNA